MIGAAQGQRGSRRRTGTSSATNWPRCCWSRRPPTSFKPGCIPPATRWCIPCLRVTIASALSFGSIRAPVHALSQAPAHPVDSSFNRSASPMIRGPGWVPGVGSAVRPILLLCVSNLRYYHRAASQKTHCLQLEDFHVGYCAGVRREVSTHIARKLFTVAREIETYRKI